MECDLPERRANLLFPRAGAIPPRFGDVQILGAVLRNNLGQPGPPEEFKLLLLDPPAVRLGLTLPVPVRAAQVTATGMALEQNRLARECTQQQVQSERVGVCSCGIAMPGDLYQVAICRWKNSREDFGQSIRVTRPGKKDRARFRVSGSRRTPAPVVPHLRGAGVLLANPRRHPRGLASALLLPEIAKAVLEPREDHWMITNRLNKQRRVCGGIRPLVVCEN